MRGNCWTRHLGLVALATILLAWPSPVGAGGPADDLALAERYAPVLYFHADELFRPQPVEVMVEQARLRQARTAWFDVNVLNELSVADLFLYHGAEYFLDAWYGDSGASDYKNYSAHRAHYAASLSPEAGGPPVTAYARVVRGDEHIVIQYWLFYFYNDWFNKHEGDWEMVQVVLSREELPLWVVLSQHHGGTRRPWSAVLVEDETHPAAFVALGSHANYFWGDEVYANVRSVGGNTFAVVDRTGRAGRVLPQVLLLPEREDVVANPAAWAGMEWLRFGGNWGERAAQADFGGPRGPADKAEQWARPYDWATAQPADEGEWYQHRLRVTVETDEPVQVDLVGANGRPVPDVDRVEEPGGRRVTLLLHRDPESAADYGFSVSAGQGARVRVSTSNFIPKPHTPFQWAAAMGADDLAVRHDLLRRRLKGAGIALSWEEPAHSLLEAVLSRGDRRIGAAVLRAWKAGARFDAWNEISDRRRWDAAFSEIGLDPAFYAHRERDLHEVLPWSHIDTGVSDDFLKEELRRAEKGEDTPDCRNNPCNSCGLEQLQNCRDK